MTQDALTTISSAAANIVHELFPQGLNPVQNAQAAEANLATQLQLQQFQQQAAISSIPWGPILLIGGIVGLVWVMRKH
jgi:di/tricarboxylate transporter